MGRPLLPGLPCGRSPALPASREFPPCRLITLYLPAANYDPLFAQPANSDNYPNNAHRWGFTVLILPYIEQKQMYDDLYQKYIGKVDSNGTSYSPWYNFVHTQTWINAYFCPLITCHLCHARLPRIIEAYGNVVSSWVPSRGGRSYEAF